MTNSSITFGATPVALGATVSTFSGLTSVAATTFTGALSGNASTATNVAGTGITGTTLASNVVNSSLTSVGTLGSLAVTGTATAGTFSGSGASLTSIPNSALVGSGALTLGSTSMALGSITTTIVGLSSVTSTTFVGALTGHASSDVALAGSTMTGLLILSGDPSAALGAATKQYVDAISAGISAHASCETATTAASNLSANTYTNGVAGGSPDTGLGVGATIKATANVVLGTVGGYAGLQVGSRLLVKDQADTTQNGVYVVTSLGSTSGPTTPWILTRAADYNNSIYGEVHAGDTSYIQEGTLTGTQWVQTSVGTQSPGDVTKIGLTFDPIVFSQFASPGIYTAGTGISVTSGVIANTGVLSLTTSSGLSTNTSATGNVSITNTGVTSIVAGTNISVSGATGAVTVNVSGTVANATNAVNATNATYIVGGATNSVPYQTGSGVTAFLAQGTGVLQETAGAPVWTTTPTLTGTNFSGIGNGALTNSSLTVGSTNIALGATSLTLSGLTSVAATTFTGALSGNATTATTATNLAVGASGALPYQSSAGATAMLTAGSTSQVLISGTTPSWTNTPTLTGTNFTGIPNSGLTNSSVTVTAGTGMSGGGAVSLGGTVTLTNAGVTSAVAGTAISVSGATGAVTITNTGVTSIAGTTNQITLSAATGGVTVSLPAAVTISGTMTAGAFNATSTKRVKKAIKDLSKTYLAKFDDLRPREYDRKDYVGHEFGFVAEEMALVYPEIVGHDDKGRASGIDYGRLSAILTAKVQDQQSTIDKLKEQMAMVMEMLKGSK